jgi:hypothetical protein
MSLLRWSSSLLLIISFGIAGCAVPPPPPIPATPSPADLLRAATAGDTTAVAITAPSAPHPTLPQFLGIPQCFAATQVCCARTLSCVGFLFPGLGAALEPTPPLLPLTDPANLAPNAPPAVQKAAEIKAKEDAAPQKIAALRYLATIGCGGCYESVEDAFLAALEDCTEAVRYEAIKAIRDTTTNHCQFCNQQACCSAKIQKKLREMALETDDAGCPKEPSERVRRQARLALAECGPPETEPQPEVEEPDDLEEVPDDGPLEEAPADTNGLPPPDAPALPPPADSDEETDPLAGAVPTGANSTVTASKPPAKPSSTTPRRLPIPAAGIPSRSTPPSFKR